MNVGLETWLLSFLLHRQVMSRKDTDWEAGNWIPSQDPKPSGSELHCIRSFLHKIHEDSHGSRSPAVRGTSVPSVGTAARRTCQWISVLCRGERVCPRAWNGRGGESSRAISSLPHTNGSWYVYLLVLRVISPQPPLRLHSWLGNEERHLRLYTAFVSTRQCGRLAPANRGRAGGTVRGV
jgi:hypothetical protein